MPTILETILASPWTSLGIGLLLIVLERRMAGTNTMLVAAWCCFVVAVFRMPFVLALSPLPRMLWAAFLSSGLALLMYHTLWTPRALPQGERPESVTSGSQSPREVPRSREPQFDPEASYIRDNIGELAYELRQVSGRQFRKECLLLNGETLGAEKPAMTLLALTPNGKFTVVKSLHPLTTAFAGVESGFLFQPNTPDLGGRRVKPRYEKVFEEYSSLLRKPWVIAADRYKDGEPLTGNETFNICLYGLRDIDEASIEALLAALDAAEAACAPRVRRFLQADPPNFVAHAETNSERPVIARGTRVIVDVTDQPEARIGDVYDPATKTFKRPNSER